MRQTLGCLTSLALIAATVPGTALAGGVFFGFGGSFGNVDFDRDIFAANQTPSDDSFAGEWHIGYRFDSKLVIEGGGAQGFSLDLLILGDAFFLDDKHVMVGYEFQPAKRLSIVPQLGVSYWDLETEDGPGFFFFGSQRVDFDGSGNDWIGRVTFEWPKTTKRFRPYAAYTEGHYDFGESRALSFGARFQF